jgi:hypothetical protein
MALMTRNGPRSRRFRSLTTIVAAVLLLPACSVDLDPTPEPAASATAVSFGPDDVPVGSLIDTSATAWESVDAWTSEMRIDSPESTDASGSSSATTEQVMLPGDRHVLSMNGETVVTEEIVVDGRVYMRGTLVSSAIYPAVDAETWITFDPDQVPPETVLDQRVAYLLAPPEFPFASVTPETRALPAQPVGDVQVGDRTCEAWQFTTATGDDDGIEHRIAFDAEGRPCRLIREGGGVVETTIWTYPAEPEPITAPADAVTVEAFPGAPG